MSSHRKHKADPPSFKGARQQLHAALVEQVATHKETTPCLVRPAGLDWLDPRHEQQAAAAALCATCPALRACKNYISGHPLEPGVWAGTTEQHREARSASMRAVSAARPATA